MSPALPDRIAWALARLEVRAGDTVLEIGCGNGRAIERLWPQLAGGHVTGIDRSAAAVATAGRRVAPGLVAGRVTLQQVALAELAVPAACFGRAFAVDVNVFWQQPTAELAVLARVLVPGGRLWLVFEPPAAAQLEPIAHACGARLGEAGFAAIAVVRHPRLPIVGVAARAPAGAVHSKLAAKIASRR